MHFLKEANPCASVALNKIPEFQVNHLLPALLSRLRSQMVIVRDKLINLVSKLTAPQFFLIALQHKLRNIFLVYKATTMLQPNLVILLILPEKKNKKLKELQEVNSSHAKHSETASF